MNQGKRWRVSLPQHICCVPRRLARAVRHGSLALDTFTGCLAFGTNASLLAPGTELASEV